MSIQPLDGVALKVWEGEIGQLCRALNALGAVPPWTLQRLSVYANEKFSVTYGLADLTPAQLGELKDDLSARLDVRLAERAARLSPGTPRARRTPNGPPGKRRTEPTRRGTRRAKRAAFSLFAPE